MLERVQKYLSSAGIASRRKAEEFIKSGQVTVNGKQVKLGDKVDPKKDIVKVYGKIVEPAEKEYKTKVWNVGRLDFGTEGLLILTNDGELTQELSHPKYEHEKEYEVTTYEQPEEYQLEKLRQGVEIVTGLTSPAKIKLKHGKVYTTIHEGKKHQIKRMFDTVGLSVTGLKRIRINKLTLPPNLPPGNFKLVKKEEII
jgi:23S rRNA pseudouridine2605 synthase